MPAVPLHRKPVANAPHPNPLPASGARERSGAAPRPARAGRGSGGGNGSIIGRNTAPRPARAGRGRGPRSGRVRGGGRRISAQPGEPPSPIGRASNRWGSGEYRPARPRYLSAWKRRDDPDLSNIGLARCECRPSAKRNLSCRGLLSLGPLRRRPWASPGCSARTPCCPSRRRPLRRM